MRILRLHTLALTFVLIASACVGGSDSTPIVTGTSPDGSIVVGDTAPPNTPPPPPVCAADTPVVRAGTPNPSTEFFNEGPGLASVHISQATFECATQVVIVSDLDLNRVAIAAVLAAALKAPLLVGSANAAGIIGFEIERLAPGQIIAVGDDVTFTAPEWTEIVTLSGDTSSLAGQINALAGFGSTTPLPAVPGAATLITAVNAIEARTGLIPPVVPATTTTTQSSDQTTVTTVPPAPVEVEFEVPSLTAGTGVTGVAILVDGNQAATALAAFATATASGAIASLIDSADLRAVPGAGRALQSIPGGVGSIQIFGEVTTDSHWQLDVIRSAEELPGGGFLVLPRLFVALYGSPLAARLGALGEQGAIEAAIRAKQVATQFSGADAPVVPTFEMITTNAHASPGPDGNWSTEHDASVFQPWIDLAAQEDIYVILDLQPGSSDFINQAILYEDLLLNPHVGLALDPEWRFKHPDQLINGHDRRGAASAAEVNAVIEWLADLVQQHDLPQKVLLLHQFRRDMLPDRENIVPRPELQLIIQMDGFGSFAAKMDTWEGWDNINDRPFGVTLGPDARSDFKNRAPAWFSWGWKNFYDEDTPGGGQSWAELSQLDPEVVYVSYQ